MNLLTEIKLINLQINLFYEIYVDFIKYDVLKLVLSISVVD